ncbi:MAG: hypothetical protein IT423_08740, partial [Pirellulaceae bacterium]|nr:hypothetical protein [Pirellulaceae bacterium]
MDWIDPRFAEEIKAERDESIGTATKSGKPRRKTLVSRTRAALAQPIDVWSAAYDHALGRLCWPKHLTPESTFLWSCVLLEQAEILVRAGMSAKQISGLAQAVPSSSEVDAARSASPDSAGRESVSGLMSWPI